MPITKPNSDEYGPYYDTYVSKVPGSCALAALEAQRESTRRFLATIPESRAAFRYAPGKWTLREVIGHMADTERVFGYRMFCFARNDKAPLPSFDENSYVPEGRFEKRTLADVVAEFLAVRDATLPLARTLDAETMLYRGTASGKTMSARAAAWIIAGHEVHHLAVLRERYL